MKLVVEDVALGIIYKDNAGGDSPQVSVAVDHHSLSPAETMVALGQIMDTVQGVRDRLVKDLEAKSGKHGPLVRQKLMEAFRAGYRAGATGMRTHETEEPDGGLKL